MVGKKERYEKIWKILKKHYGKAECALIHKNAFELLIATILSAQCTDKRVNMVTPALFKKYPTPKAFAQAPLENIEKMVQSTGFYRNKAKNIQKASRMIVDEFGGKVPDKMEDLLQLAGVARKTANVVLGTWYGIPSGVVVDTHVGRLSNRMGFTKEKNPVKIERDLMALVSQKDWIQFSHSLIWHGRKICDARTPKCEVCPVLQYCPFGKKKK